MHFPHIKFRILYTLKIIYYKNCYSIATNCDPIHDLSNNFHAKIATQLYKIISDTDIHLNMFAGYFSWRHKELGSWFIQDLVKVFQQHHNALDVLSMLTLVNGKVAFEHESNALGMIMKRQMPCIVSQLTKHFYLKSKINKED